MFKRFVSMVWVMIFLFCGATSAISSSEHKKGSDEKYKTAIVLASFGTTVPSALKSIINIQDEIKKEFPGIPVKLTFTQPLHWQTSCPIPGNDGSQ